MITYNYKKVDVPGWSGTICEIVVNNVLFVSLGLDKKEAIIKPICTAWFEQHKEEVERVCSAIPDYDRTNLGAYQIAIRQKHRLLDRFCHECKIKDS